MLFLRAKRNLIPSLPLILNSNKSTVIFFTYGMRRNGPYLLRVSMFFRHLPQTPLSNVDKKSMIGLLVLVSFMTYPSQRSCMT